VNEQWPALVGLVAMVAVPLLAFPQLRRERELRVSRVAAVSAAGAVTALILPWLLIATLGAAFTCSDVCSSTDGWRGRPQAWQYDVQMLLAIAGGGCLALAVRKRVTGSVRPAKAFAAGGVAAFVLWLVVWGWP
jgi:hypothetical protein